MNTNHKNAVDFIEHVKTNGCYYELGYQQAELEITGNRDHLMSVISDQFNMNLLIDVADGIDASEARNAADAAFDDGYEYRYSIIGEEPETLDFN